MLSKHFEQGQFLSFCPRVKGLANPDRKNTIQVEFASKFRSVSASICPNDQRIDLLVLEPGLPQTPTYLSEGWEHYCRLLSRTPFPYIRSKWNEGQGFRIHWIHPEGHAIFNSKSPREDAFSTTGDCIISLTNLGLEGSLQGHLI